MRKERLPLVIAGVVALLGAMWGGLVRLGWLYPGPAGLRLSTVHGPLMVVGFLGTVIGAERAIASKRGWAFAAPILAAASALVSLAAPSSPVGPALGLGAAVALGAIVVRALSRSPSLHIALELCGALSFASAQVLLLSGAMVASAAPWWLGFLLLTIFAERVEASRMVAPSRAGKLLMGAAVAAFGAGLLATLVDVEIAARVRGAAMCAMAVWIAVFDVPRRTVRRSGLPRFVAISLLLSAAWLAIAGAIALARGWSVVGPLYDANLHAAFLGAVMAMIFAHAPLIFPAILGVRMPMRRRFYVHVTLLHASVAARVVGDLAGVPSLRTWGGLLNVVAILLFLASTAAAAVEGRAASRR